MQQLLNPFAQKYPETVDCTLPSQAATCVEFNPSGPYAGHYLAAGGADGCVEVWDVETRGLHRWFEGHVKAVGGVSWSRNNRYLLSCSLDSTAIIWDLSLLAHPLLHPRTPLATSSKLSSSSSRVQTIRFDAPVASAEFHPRNSKIVLATLTCNEVVLVDLREGRRQVVLEDTANDDEEMDVDAEDRPSRTKASLSCAVWSPCGSRIYAGSTQGELLVFDPVSRVVLNRYKVANAAIREVSFDSRGETLVCSASDRAVRTLLVSPLLGTLTATHRFQDLVNRTPWNAVGFSGDAEYVIGGAGHKMGHNVFIWDRAYGTLVKVLEGPRESLLDCDWHPTRPVIASASANGSIYLWHTSSPDNWAAFAPGFEELEENVEYDEREDEFDIEDETELSRRQNAEEDLDVDVFANDDTIPRRPQPILTLLSSVDSTTNSPKEAGGGLEEMEEVKSVRMMEEAKKWADEEPDDDIWERFFISLDLLEPPIG